MSLKLANYKKEASTAVKVFWGNRQTNFTGDNRLAVVGGKNLDGFHDLVVKVVLANGLTADSIKVNKGDLGMPGFYRATKDWDLAVVHNDILVAAFEFKSQVGSFGNNFNNRTEEAMGSALDLRTAYREGALGQNAPKPFLGYLVMLEDCPQVNRPVKARSKYFDVFPEFDGASYASRYKLFCEKLVSEGMYESATLIMSSREGGVRGEYKDYYLKDFVTKLAAKIAQVKAMDD